MVTPKQMHLDSAQITSNNQATFRTLARGIQGIIYSTGARSFTGWFLNAAVAPPAHGSAFWHSRPGQGCKRRALDPNTNLAGRVFED